jgi:chromosomal replication initiation ATPase DnaA
MKALLIDPGDAGPCIDDLGAANALLQSSPPTFNEIADIVCRRYHIALQQITGHRHFPDITKPRHVLIFLARKLTRLSLAQIAMRMGNRNISTIKEAETSVSRRIEGNEHMRDEIDLLRIAIAERVMRRR